MSNSNNIPTVNARDLSFQLFEVLDVDSLATFEAYSDHDNISLRASLETAQDIAAKYYQSHYREADLAEPKLVNGKVVLLPQIGEALRAFVDAGFMVADRPLDEGGMALPFTIYQACLACFQAANIGTSSYAFLTIAGANLIRAYGTDAQKRTYMDPMLQGHFLGTMCLSEPEAGSGLADVRTAAIPQPDGSYLIKGSKMWISGGEHEMSDNIVHLVLARIAGAPAGTRGLSLFIVPRKRISEGGSVGQDNDVSLLGLNHKMGYRATVNTILNFGESDACRGELIGEPHQGLAAMFHMMNEARISVGVGATMLGGAGYLYARDYARGRLQGRQQGTKDPTSPRVPIIEHADVRRMLLAQKSYSEGALALCLYAARLVDIGRAAPNLGEREKAELLLAILTPVVKSWPSEFCLEANKLAIQVLGGYGYTRDYPVEQFYRDNRLNLIHEGTNGIQAIDLLGRKIPQNDRAAFNALLEEVQNDIDVATSPELATFAAQLQTALNRIADCTAALLSTALDPRHRTANASYYLDMFGHFLVAWMWLRQARVASNALAKNASGDEAVFYRGKMTACRYFFEFELGRIDHWLPLLASANPLFADLESGGI